MFAHASSPFVKETEFRWDMFRECEKHLVPSDALCELVMSMPVASRITSCASSFLNHSVTASRVPVSGAFTSICSTGALRSALTATCDSGNPTLAATAARSSPSECGAGAARRYTLTNTGSPPGGGSPLRAHRRKSPAGTSCTTAFFSIGK